MPERCSLGKGPTGAIRPSDQVLAVRDAARVAIGLGCVWGLYAFVAMVLNSMNFGPSDTLPYVVMMVVYGLTLLPSCLLSIWYPKFPALWLVALGPLTAAGFLYQIVGRTSWEKAMGNFTSDVLTALFLAAIPFALGIVLFVTRERKA